jgi:DNA-binding response OmpR family regulator
VSKGKILVVEDEKDLLKLLKLTFEKAGFGVLTAKDAETGLDLARSEPLDLVVLDVMLPKMDGLEMCQTLRRELEAPILMLSARKGELDRALGLKLGADDYVAKPFSFVELMARVESLLRRSNGRAAPDLKQAVAIGALEVDFERHQVRVRGKSASLTNKEFEFLKMLIEADGKVLARKRLLESIWGAERGAKMSVRTIDQHVARLRRKLKSEGKRIVTVTNSGYQIKMN